MNQMQLYKVTAWVGPDTTLREKIVGVCGDDIESVRELAKSAMQIKDRESFAIKSVEYVDDVYFDMKRGDK